MQDMDQRDRELVVALQGEIPLVSTPFAFLGQTLEMSEKEVIKRAERMRREGVIRQLAAQFDTRALGYRSCLVAARVSPERIDDAAAIVSAHPGVTQNYRRNNELNLWFTLNVSPFSKLGLDKTVEFLGAEAECDSVRPLPTLKLYKSSDSESSENASESTPLTPLEVECVRLLQRELPLQPRPFDAAARGSGVSADELLETARTLRKRGQIRRFCASISQRKSGFAATAMGVWVVPQDRVEEDVPKLTVHDVSDPPNPKLVAHRAVSHCYLRPVYDDWPYNVYTTVHARSVDECESIINDLAIDSGLTQKQALFPTKEYKKARLNLFSPEADEWEDARASMSARALAIG